eukprot:12904076-Prorocentrum_lima.AAC.1
MAHAMLETKMSHANMASAKLEFELISFSALEANMLSHKAGDQRCQLQCHASQHGACKAGEQRHI